MAAMAFKDEEILKKALQMLEKKMNLTEYTRFLQLISSGGGDTTKELVERRRALNVDMAYTRFLKRIKKA